MSNIEWTDVTWNPFVGCTKISAGCTHCYAINQAYRNHAMAAKMPNPGRMKYYEGLTHKKGDRTDWTGFVRFVPEALEIPLRWKKPRKIFVNSMSDLFHESIPFEQIDRVVAVMALTPQHTYQVLTKRPERMLEYVQSAKNRIRIAAIDLGRAKGIEHSDIESCQWDWPLPNVWLGATVENQKAADDRIPLLLQTPAAIRFLSVEPLLEKVDLNLLHVEGITNLDCLRGHHGVSYPLQGRCNKINWVIIGGESGPGARECNIEWIKSALKQCKSADVPAFVKQLGSRPSNLPTYVSLKDKLRDRKGANLSEWPEDLRVREFPAESTR
jgi:protein gp37